MRDGGNYGLIHDDTRAAGWKKITLQGRDED
jgi:hypothetical protein